MLMNLISHLYSGTMYNLPSRSLFGKELYNGLLSTPVKCLD